MDLIIFERKAFEEFATKIEQFVHSASIELTRCKGWQEEDKQLARPSGCLSEVENQQAYITDLAR